MSRTLRVQHIPAQHPYVEHLRPVVASGDDGSAGDGVVHLPDPPVPGAAPGVWWPHPTLDADWVDAHADGLDLVHLHFGTESRTADELRSWLESLRRNRIPLVMTVHDLEHPQLREQAPYREQLDLLVPAADALLTLTPGAAAEIRRRWGRDARVVTHPHLAPLELVGAERPAHDGLRVGVHLKSLRPNLDPVTVLPALAEVVRRRGGVLEVLHHREILEPTFDRYDRVLAELLVELAASGRAAVVATPRLDDLELAEHLRSLDVSVLPYAWGTHSGWVELCRDLGTWVMAPEVGYAAEQWDGVLTWGPAGQAPEVTVLEGLLGRVETGRPPAVTREERVAERAELAAVHEDLYRRLLEG